MLGLLYVSVSEPPLSSAVSKPVSAFSDLKLGGHLKREISGGGEAFSRNVPSNPNEAGAFGHGEAIADL